MRFGNETFLELNKSLNYTSESTVGIVYKTAEELGVSNQLGIYIPKLMMNISPQKGQPVEGTVSLNYNKIVNSERKSVGDYTVKVRNYSIVNCIAPTNTSIPQYALYEKVFVDFIDQDIKTMYFTIDTLANPGQRKSDIFRIGAISPNVKQRGQDVESSKANFYYMEFDTKNKRIVIQNSAVNAEKFQYTILLDAKNGTLSLTDSDRAVTIKSSEDRVTIQNKADSLITLEGDTIDIKCKKFNLEATESINIKTRKETIETTNLEETAKKVVFKHDNVEITSKNTKAKLDVYETKSNLYKIEVPMLDCQVQGVAVKGALAATAIALGPTPPSPSVPPSIPKGASVSEMGQTVVKLGRMAVNQNAGSVPLAKATTLQQVLIQMCIEIDKAQAGVPMPPTASITVIPITAQIASNSVQGS